MIPRIRGRSAEIEKGQGHDGKFCYEISVWTFDGEKQLGDSHVIGPFDTIEIARAEGLKFVRSISEKIEKDQTGEISGKFLDMKNGGILRPWDQQ